MNKFSRVLNFLRREKFYLFLLVLIIFINIALSLFVQFLDDSGSGKISENKDFTREEIISAEKIKDAIASNSAVYFIFVFLFAIFIFFVISGIGLDIIYLYLSRRDKTPISRTQPIESARWGLWDICKVAIIFLFTQRIMLLAEIFLFSAVPYLETKQSLRLVLSSAVMDIIAVAAVLYFVLNERRQDITALGLTIKRFFKNVKYGIFSYIGLIPILALVMYLTTVLFRMFNIPLEPQPVLVLLQNEKHIPSLIFMSFFAAFLGPFLEEIFFRGFAYGAFKKRLGVFWGIAISAVFFAYIHTNLASFLPILCLGLLLAYLYEKTGSLIPSVTVHIIHNSLSLFVLLFIKVITS